MESEKREPASSDSEASSPEQEFGLSFPDWLATDFYECEVAEVKNWVMYVESKSGTPKLFDKIPHFEAFLHCCIARCDIFLKNLFFSFVEPAHERLVSLIPIIVWTYCSQQSKRYLEPILVDLYESLRRQYHPYFDAMPFLGELEKISRSPINLKDKEELVTLLLAIYSLQIRGMEAMSVNTFLVLVLNLTQGMMPPPKNPQDIFKACPSGRTTQARLSRRNLLLLLSAIQQLPPEYKEGCDRAFKAIYDYSIQQVYCDVILICEELAK